MSAQFSFATAFSPLVVGDDPQQRIAGAYVEALESIGGHLAEVGAASSDVPFLVFVATGGTEQIVLDLLAVRAERMSGEPVLLVAHPANNSLPASLEHLARVQQDGMRGRILYLRGADDIGGLAHIEAALRDVAVRRQLQSTRLGLIGPASDWLVASMPAPATVRSAWGPEVVPIPIAELEARYRSVSADAIEPAVALLRAGVADIVEPDAPGLEDSARMYAAMRDLVAEHELDALTLRCFDLLLSDKTTGCFALSALTDAGVISGCESDLVSTVGLLWTRLLLGETPWMANPSQLDVEANSLVLAHCTVPRGLVENVRMRSHCESGLGVGIQGDLALGPVTLLRIGGKLMDRLWVAEGEITATGDNENLCRTQAHITLSRGHVTELLHAPLGNHTILVLGHHADRLVEWFESIR
jgi:L-fucose isomerase-like protein